MLDVEDKPPSFAVVVMFIICVGTAVYTLVDFAERQEKAELHLNPPIVSVDGPLLIIERSAILASQIVFVDRYGRVFTTRAGSNGFDTNLSQEEVLVLWKEALANERYTVDP